MASCCRASVTPNTAAAPSARPATMLATTRSANRFSAMGPAGLPDPFHRLGRRPPRRPTRRRGSDRRSGPTYGGAGYTGRGRGRVDHTRRPRRKPRRSVCTRGGNCCRLRRRPRWVMSCPRCSCRPTRRRVIVPPPVRPTPDTLPTSAAHTPPRRSRTPTLIVPTAKATISRTDGGEPKGSARSVPWPSS